MRTIMKVLIVFLVRCRLHLHKYEHFKFNNQKSSAVYYFDDFGVWKIWLGIVEPSNVSLSWLLSDEIEITSMGKP